jgi:hypothetical protein
VNYRKITVALLAVAFLAGCATYTTPAGGVSFPQITEPNIAAALSRQPAAAFPARLIVARVQAPGYVPNASPAHGTGRYSVVTNRDIETEADFTRIGSMPAVAAVGTVNRLLLPANLDTAQQLREAAAQLHGDILLLYTLDTSFRTDTQNIGPLQVVSLGFFRNRQSSVAATCSVAFLDVRTGFVYGVSEATAIEQQRSDLWGTHNAIEKARHIAERQAFAQALDEIEKTWRKIHAEYASPRG